MILVRDDMGCEVALPQEASRIVSLVPSDTYSVVELGKRATLVARTQFCIHPAKDLLDLESVGGTKTPKVQRIIELAPDLVLANKEENCEEHILALKAANIPVYVSLPTGPDSNDKYLKDLGKMLGVVELAKGALDTLSLVSTAPKSKPRTLYFIWKGPYMGIGTDTYIYNSLLHTGFLPVLPEQTKRYPPWSDEAIRASGAEVVLFPSEPFHFKSKHVEAFAKRFPDLPAVKNNQLHCLPGEHASWYGMWALKGLPALTELALRVST